MIRSKRKSFVKLLANSKEVLNKCLIENLPLNIFLVDREGYIGWANDRLLKFVNLTLKEVEGMHISHWNYARWEHIYEVIVDKKEKIREESYQDSCFSTIRRPLFDEKGEVIGVLGVSIEKTALKKAEDAKEHFLRNIRHDIRTPVSGIIGLTAVLRDSIEKPELLGLLDSLTETSESLLALLDRVFESIQFSSGEISTLSHQFSLEETLDAVYKLHRAKAVEKNLDLKFFYDPALPKVVVGEAMHIQRIVWELLTNALKYTEEGSIKIEAHLVKDLGENILVEIAVQDTGIGIPKDKHEVVFGLFTRLTPAWAQETSGQGLGLFNVKKLVSDLGGTITLTSDPGAGSTFTTCLSFKKILETHR